MSSYLNIYGIPREHPEEKILVLDFCRSNGVYSYFVDHWHPTNWNDPEPVDLTPEMIDRFIRDAKEDYDDTKKRLEALEKYAGGNREIIQEIMELKEYLEEDLQYPLDALNFIKDLVNMTTFSDSYGGFAKYVFTIG
jgi:hypothetical protein